MATESETLTANQAWKKSNTTLSFKDWLQREKEKNIFIKNDALASVVNESKKETGVTLPDPSTQAPSNKILGINKTVLIISGIVLAGAVIYKLSNKK